MQVRRALVVCPSPDLTAQLIGWLGRAGFTTTLVSEFLPARAAIETGGPDVVVSQVKLGAYNGIHLAIGLRSRGSKTPVIVIGDEDPVLEAEARHAGAAYLRTPADESAMLVALGQISPPDCPSGRSRRKRGPLLGPSRTRVDRRGRREL